MKLFLYFLIIIFVFCVPGCRNKSNKELYPFDSTANSALSDSLNKLDSIVNGHKVTDHRTARVFSKKAMLLAIQMNSETALARAYFIAGISYFNFNNDSSYIYYTKALKLADKYNLEDIKPRIFYSLAMIYSAASDSKMHILYLDSSIRLAQRVKKYSLLSDAYNSLGNIKLHLLDSINAKAMYDSAYSIAKRNKISKETGIAMASLSRFEKDPNGTNLLLKKAIEILEKQTGNEEEIASILNNLGLQCENPDTAIKFYLSAINFAQTANANIVEIGAYNNLTYSYLELKEFEKAEECLVIHAIPLAKRIDNNDWLSTLYDSYTDVVVAQRKIAEGLSSSRKALEERVKADTKQASAQIRLLAALLDVKSKELRIQTNDKELEKKENKIQAVTLWFSIAFIAIFLILSFLVWKFQRNKIKYQSEQFESAKRLIDIEENMKGRVSMELHDLVTPFYTIFRQQIEEAQIKDHKIEKSLKDNLSTMTSNLRQISHRMNNSFIEQLTIPELVKGLCKDLEGTTNIPIHCRISSEKFNLTEDQIIHIYRIIQELLTNAVKYVTSGEISITLSEEIGSFFIIYRDTGSGFDNRENQKKGLGILNIFERTNIIGGKAVLNTSPGRGTKWNISIPIKNTKNAYS